MEYLDRAPPRGCPQSDQFLFGKTHEQKHGKRQIYFPSINFGGIMGYPFFLSNSKKCMKIDLNQPESDLDHRKKNISNLNLICTTVQMWMFPMTFQHHLWIPGRNLKTHQRSCRSQDCAGPRLCSQRANVAWCQERNPANGQYSPPIRRIFGSLMETRKAAINLPNFFIYKGMVYSVYSPHLCL